MAENKLREGRFTALSQQEIYGSIAFARANFNNGILAQHKFEEIERGLLEVGKEWAAANFEIVQGNEGEIISKDIAGKLHTG
ncbi:hypothetical protein K4K58_007803 [Colletotrichum sp. SAR11_239]|nr:hypothetical protein K4K58_007803 [Colletotrichum sp. SAR11_239]